MDIKNLDLYVENVSESGFPRGNIIVEHRSDNPKRDFLFVNRKQCKHIPCSAREMISMCKMLADVIKSRISPDLRVAVAAFAETATAIGNFVADELPQVLRVFQTTREPLSDCGILFEFREEHSHAVQQRIYGNREDFANFDYILIIDDEITTGKTALNFIEGLNREGVNLRFGIASVCNWQSDEERQNFRGKGIDLFYLLSGRIRDVNQKMNVRALPETVREYPHPKRVDIVEVEVPGQEQLAHKPNRDFSALFSELESLKLEGETIRVIGTEEFMYIPIRAAEYLENRGYSVVCHSTTRSPIDVIDRSPGGIYAKIRLSSVYDSTRETYLYNFDNRTDIAIVITDAEVCDFGRFLKCGRLIILRVKEEKCG